MKLLIVTQAVDRQDPNLGAFYWWFEEFARRCDTVVILAARVGEQSLPNNVRIYTFGAPARIGRVWKFWELFSREYAGCDAVLFHQIPEFAVAASPFLLARPRASALWYAHGRVTGTLRIAERLVRTVFTSSEEGFRLPSKKALWVGQAINTDIFSPAAMTVGGGARDVVRMITVGRVAPVKNHEAIIEALVVLKKTWEKAWTLDIVGGPLMARDGEYLAMLKRRVEEAHLENEIRFLGPRPFTEIADILREHDLFLNMSRTGSLDKAVLEAMSCGIPVITANESYRALLPARYFLERADPDALAQRIMAVAEEKLPNAALRDSVVADHGLRRTIGRMIDVLAKQA